MMHIGHYASHSPITDFMTFSTHRLSPAPLNNFKRFPFA